MGYKQEIKQIKMDKPIKVKEVSSDTTLSDELKKQKNCRNKI